MNSVLVVDDESGIRELIRRWLSPIGYDIREAADAETAIAEMAKSPADVVLCDVQMPGRDGVWLAGRLRALYPTSAIVFATSVDSIPAATSMQAGIIEYLLKPLAGERVVDAVAQAVEWHDKALTTPIAAIQSDAVTTWMKTLGRR